VLSAGAVQSPRLLQLSGVGPAAQLEEVGVPCLHDMPEVGQNMQDHMLMFVPYRSRVPGADVGSLNTAKAEGFPGALHNLYRWQCHGDGVLATSTYDASCFYRSGRHPEKAWPDVQIGMFCSAPSRELLEDNFRMDPSGLGLSDADLRPDAQLGLMVATLLHPKSKGSVRLRSSDPAQPPLIDACYLSDVDGDDLATLREGMKGALAIGSQAPFADLLEPVLPTVEGVEPGSDAHYEELIRRFATTIYHPCGTCAIGKVVDAKLRVKGLEGLRVIDASVFPEIISGNTNAPAIMVGEKGARLIAADHGLAVSGIPSLSKTEAADSKKMPARGGA